MKTLYIIRHAKSDQSFFGKDFDRPLNDRGNRDAPDMAKRLVKKKVKPDLFVSSPSVRTQQTAAYFCKAFDVPKEKVLLVDELYHASAEQLYASILQLPETAHTILLFAHNPGITYFVNSLTDAITVDNMPTSAIFAIQADCEQWQQFETATKKFLFFDYPKSKSN